MNIFFDFGEEYHNNCWKFEEILFWGVSTFVWFLQTKAVQLIRFNDVYLFFLLMKVSIFQWEIFLMKLVKISWKKYLRKLVQS